ncbi:hypothetical protein KFE25_011192 [Diacronema lutheri]|uniref:S1 motif domain-containing protein n=2 Tax=Diacronema lutheri TaxID=2081491 RepID=A0A8J5XPQ9_DIALT|nr:hypothetical protein KFE25_011192 [Diacronema lutheri]
MAPTAVAFGAALSLALLLGGGAHAAAPPPRGTQPAPRAGAFGRAAGAARADRFRITVGRERREGTRDDADARVADAALVRSMRPAAGAGAGGVPVRLDEWLPTVAEGDRFAGRVTRVCAYGAFVEIVPSSSSDPRDPDLFLQQGFDRPWRPIGLLHISALSSERVADVEAFTKAAVGPEGTRVVVALKSTVFNAKKRIALDLVEVLQREDAWLEPVRKVSNPADARRPAAAAAGAASAGARADRAGGAEWLAAARAARPSCRIGRTSAARWAVWAQDGVKRGVGSLPVGAALDAANAEDEADAPAQRPDRRKAVILRNV